MNKKPKRVALYLRVSKDESTTENQRRQDETADDSFHRTRLLVSCRIESSVLKKSA